MLGFLIVGGGASAPRTRREIPRGRRKKKVKAMSRQGGPWATAVTVLKAVERLSPLLRTAAALVAATAGLAIALGVLGWMKPALENANVSSGTAQTMTFSYSAKVPRSPAYDGTTVTSPEPIFRKLAHRVDVTMRYQGQPGVLAVSASLSDGSGWHTTMEMSPPKTFSSAPYDTTVTLDLDAIERRAVTAAETIGIQPSPTTITLKARVISPDGPDFNAPLQLVLDPLQLRLGNGDASLQVTRTAAKNGATVIPREIKVLGHPDDHGAKCPLLRRPAPVGRRGRLHGHHARDPQ